MKSGFLPNGGNLPALEVHMRRRTGIVLLFLLASLSCVHTTDFYGSAKVPNGAEGCRSICTSYGMELAGMVALGQYSDGCICEVPGKRVSGGAAAAGASAAVMAAIQEKDRDAEAAQSQVVPR